MKKVGVIINPVAGLGGRVGLKGSDGAEIQHQALELGGRSESFERTLQALRMLSQTSDSLEFFTYPGEMGETAVREAGLNPVVSGAIQTGHTTPEDTVRAAKDMAARQVDLILFAGGDGTARNIYSAIGQSIPVLGIPAGVKMHSGVYAVNPEAAGRAVVQYLGASLLETREAEVMDLDEEAYRQGRVSARLYGYMQVPANRKCIQNVKVRSQSESTTLMGISQDVVNNMEPDRIYIIGPGTTTRSIMERLGLDNTLIGVDVVRNGELVTSDVSERRLWELIKDQSATVIVTAIGGQGHIFGRGNQQLSPRILKELGRENIQIVATKDKLLAIPKKTLLVDTGDSQLNQSLSGFTKVVTGFMESTMCRVSA